VQSGLRLKTCLKVVRDGLDMVGGFLFCMEGKFDVIGRSGCGHVGQAGDCGPPY